MKKILIVDDEIEQIFSIEKSFDTLYSNEYQILSATSAEKCFKILKKITPDIIILDLMMPVVNGMQVLEKIKNNEKWENIPILILTARTDGFARHASILMADDYIPKPVNIQELKIRIDKIIKKYEKK